VTRPPAARADERQRGAVTVEIAVALPALTAFLAVLLAVGVVVISQVRCVEGARAGAREAALGSSDADIARVVGAVAGGRVRTTVARSHGMVTVTVTMPIAWGDLAIPGRYEVDASAHAACEPDRGCA
jgi:Flp pilus assembly protein TadG